MYGTTLNVKIVTQGEELRADPVDAIAMQSKPDKIFKSGDFTLNIWFGEGVKFSKATKIFAQGVLYNFKQRMSHTK